MITAERSDALYRLTMECRTPNRELHNSIVFVNTFNCINVTFNCVYVTVNCVYVTSNCVCVTLHCVKVTFNCVYVTFNCVYITFLWDVMQLNVMHDEKYNWLKSLRWRESVGRGGRGGGCVRIPEGRPQTSRQSTGSPGTAKSNLTVISYHDLISHLLLLIWSQVYSIHEE